MGNIMDSVTAERDLTVEITKDILDELKELIETVDHSLAGLAKSVDSMQAACEMLLSQYESGKLDSSGSYSEDGTKSDKNLALYLLRTINESVYDHKFIAVGTLMKLLKFITDKIKKHVNRTFGDKLNRSIDKYSKTKELPNDNSITYYDSRIEELWKEIGHLKKINSSQKKQIQSLHTKEEELADENDTLTKTITTLENEKRTAEEEIYAIKKDTSAIVKENEENKLKISNLNNCIKREKEKEKLRFEEKENEISEKNNCLAELHHRIEDQENNIDAIEQERLVEKMGLQDKIEQLERDKKQLTDEKLALLEEVESVNRKKIMKVQMNILSSSRHGHALIDLLKSKIETPDLKLEITTLVSPGQIKSEIPVMYVVFPYGHLKPLRSKIAEETWGIKGTSKAVILIVHNIYSQNDICSITPSEVTLKENSKTFESFGGLFDLAFHYNSSCFWSCELNDRSIEEIVNFIQNEGMKLSRWELFLNSVDVAESKKY